MKIISNKQISKAIRELSITPINTPSEIENLISIKGRKQKL
jgi:hypothetical protein